jgi:hypothetical protein
MYFEIVGPVEGIQTMAVGTRIRQIDILIEQYGNGHGIGRRRLKIKRFLD